ncbi:MAG: enoyl-CoA hydratase [Actinobacteria bacterium]|nr:enoyl-CoA hydratase [Actinomycetota bacterium]NBP52815.1 enoyl-CoA hydratase [Actinomycetota bacterium]
MSPSSSPASGSDVVLYSTPAPGVALLTLNRPDRMNAWNADLSARYFELLEHCAQSDDVRAIVVTGAGRGFCAGADMDALQSIGSSSDGGSGGAPSAEAASGSHLQSFTTTVPKPVIAAVNGACAGIGMVQALACDIRFAAAGAKFTTAFGRRGLIAEYGMSWLLPRLVGTANALDLLLSARVVLAEEAHAMGMVNAVLPADKLVDHAVAYAADLAANVSPTSMAVMKQQVYADYGMTLGDAEQKALRLMKESLRRPDFKEGVASFLEKRPPNFSPVTR